MTKYLNKILCLPALLLILSTLSLASDFKVVRVYDGDTIKAEGHDIEMNVRLVSIDAPETSREKRDLGQPLGLQSKKHLAGLVLNKAVDINGYGLGGYDRILGVIDLDGTGNTQYRDGAPISTAQAATHEAPPDYSHPYHSLGGGWDAMYPPQTGASNMGYSGPLQA